MRGDESGIVYEEVGTGKARLSIPARESACLLRGFTEGELTTFVADDGTAYTVLTAPLCGDA